LLSNFSAPLHGTLFASAVDALTGGRGTVVGTFLGVLLLGVLANGLNLLGARAEVQMFVQGVVLILAVTVDEFRRRRKGAL
jgi:ribose/xylose/arabinose/galactoside ABC-type transport system permease subunit